MKVLAYSFYKQTTECIISMLIFHLRLKYIFVLLVDCSIYKYLLFQQKAKEAPEKAEQPTETFNLGL